MSVRRILAVARAQALELSRRRVAMLLLVLLPLAFYWTSGSDQFAPAFVAVGVGWAFAIATLFLTVGMRPIAPRLSLLGFTAADQLIGRLLCSLAFGSILSLALWLYVGTDDVVINHSHLALSLFFSLVAAVATGLAVGAIFPREMEAMLLIIGVVGMQLVVDRDTLIAKILPLYAADHYAASATDRWAPNIDTAWMVTSAATAIMLVIAVVATVLRSPRRTPVR